MLWNGQSAATALAQVHPSDLDVPRPAVSVLLDGKVNTAVSSVKAIDSRVALEASISRKAHHEATMANRFGWHGPFLDLLGPDGQRNFGRLFPSGRPRPAWRPGQLDSRELRLRCPS